jgi:hypothetical protein
MGLRNRRYIVHLDKVVISHEPIWLSKAVSLSVLVSPYSPETRHWFELLINTLEPWFKHL